MRPHTIDIDQLNLPIMFENIIASDAGRKRMTAVTVITPLSTNTMFYVAKEGEPLAVWSTLAIAIDTYNKI